jgi:hypothetical protein
VNSAVFLTTIFPIKEQFLFDFFGLLSSQTYKRFDAVMVDRFEN